MDLKKSQGIVFTRLLENQNTDDKIQKQKDTKNPENKY